MTIRHRPTQLRLSAALCFALIAPALVVSAAAAQNTAGPAPAPTLPQAQSQQQPYIAIVTGSDVYVRAGAAETYYPFTKVKEGDLVKVTGERYGWQRVVIEGPVFREAFGYIKHPKGDTSRFRLSSDGASGMTLGRTDIVAPNLDANALPKDSWKAIVRLESNQTLRVIETIQGDADTIHKVALPPTATGWISGAYLKPASESQTAQYTRLLTATPEQATAARNAPTGRPAAPQPPAGTPAGANAGASPPAKVEPMTPTTIAVGNRSAPGTPPSAPDALTNAPGAGEATRQAANGIPTDDAAPATIAATEKPAGPTLDDLEAAYELLRQEPIESAEVEPLRQLYLQLGTQHPTDKKVKRYSTGRAEQLRIWGDLQQQRLKLEEVRLRMQSRANETSAAHESLERSAEYTAVGRIAASTIYDGVSLPRLYRVQDPGTGRTIAYLVPDEEFKLATRIDTIVGIVGEKTFDESLRLNIIAPKRIDVLTPAENAKPAVASGSEG